MVSHLPVIDEDGEVGDLSKVDPSLFAPAREVLPEKLYKALCDLKRKRVTTGKDPTASKTPVDQ